MAQKSRRNSPSMRKWRCWLAGSSRNASGTSKTSATSTGSGVSANGGSTQPTIGVTRNPVTVSYAASSPSTATCAGGKPTSSRASRSAACACDSSSASTRPPGKLIWPGWSGRSALRCVSSIVRPAGRLTTGTSTAAGVTRPSRPGQPEAVAHAARAVGRRAREALRDPVLLGDGGQGEQRQRHRGGARCHARGSARRL